MFDDRSLYEDDYFKRRKYGADLKRDKAYRQEIKNITQRTKFGRILDVGCGLGGFLTQADDRFTKYGIEPSDYASEIARKKGLTMFRSLNTIDYEAMDCVVFRGTLQHINTPIEDLFQASRVLKKGGLLAIIATPDADSLVYRIFGRLPALDAPRNWVVFGHRELENILKRLGFGEIEILHPYWKSPYANPVKDFMNFFLSLLFGWRPFPFPGSMMEIYARKI
jgi:SAM-dependent methyltransferase